MKTIASEWKKVEQKVIHKHAHDIQRNEMRRAFYGGALVALKVVTDISVETPDEDVAAIKLEAVHEEIRQFFRDVKEGKA